MTQIREEVSFTKGRIIVRGKLVTRGKAKVCFGRASDSANSGRYLNGHAVTSIYCSDWASCHCVTASVRREFDQSDPPPPALPHFHFFLFGLPSLTALAGTSQCRTLQLGHRSGLPSTRLIHR
jgi:hypothetical protein